MPNRRKDAAVLPLAKNLSYRVSILQALLGRRTTGIYVSRGLTSHQWKVMSVLYNRPPMPAARITELVTLDKAAISRAVVGLLKLKLANRKLDPLAGTINVILTDSGRAAYREMMIEMYDIQQQVFAGLGEDERKSLFATLDKVEQSLRKILAPDGAGVRSRGPRGKSPTERAVAKVAARPRTAGRSAAAPS